MKRFLLFFAIVLTSTSLLAANAEAKRLGGGGSIGKQRAMSPQQAQKAPAAAPAPAQGAATPPQQGGSKWLGPLAGLAIGAGLGALFASMGLGEEMGMLLMIILAGAVVMFLVSMLRRKPAPAMQYAGAGASPGGVQPPLNSGVMPPAAPSTTPDIPAGFPVESFLRAAKTTFIRLQAANDRKDLNDIREYTTPEMFAEISMQMRERGDAPQLTDVAAIDAVLLEVANEGDHAFASVRMTGQLRENDGAPESFDEIWHVQKDLRNDQSAWLLAGIQQTALH